MPQTTNPKTYHVTLSTYICQFCGRPFLCCKIYLKRALINDPVTRQKPLNYHERTGHIIPINNNLLQLTLNNLHKYTEDNLMRINMSKTKIMLFNTSRKFDFPPEMILPNSSSAECLEFRYLRISDGPNKQNLSAKEPTQNSGC